MGCGPSKEDSEQKAGLNRNAKIDRQLRQDRRQQQETVKLLLLGRSQLLSRFQLTYCDKNDFDEKQVRESLASLRLSNRCESSTQEGSDKMKRFR
jgi:hypothetical protein